jgi:hypothetical protein
MQPLEAQVQGSKVEKGVAYCHIWTALADIKAMTVPSPAQSANFAADTLHLRHGHDC